jgi:hypothetical protein
LLSRRAGGLLVGLAHRFCSQCSAGVR